EPESQRQLYLSFPEDCVPCRRRASERILCQQRPRTSREVIHRVAHVRNIRVIQYIKTLNDELRIASLAHIKPFRRSHIEVVAAREPERIPRQEWQSLYAAGPKQSSAPIARRRHIRRSSADVLRVRTAAADVHHRRQRPPIQHCFYSLRTILEGPRQEEQATRQLLSRLEVRDPIIRARHVHRMSQEVCERPRVHRVVPGKEVRRILSRIL